MPAVSKKQQQFFGIVRAIQKGEQAPTTPETAKAAADMKKSDVKKFASTKHKGLPNKVVQKEESNPRIPRKKGQPAGSKKHSDLYTDENPKGTIHGLGFKDVAKAKASVSKIRNSSRSHAHKIQAAVAMEQRAREMGKTSEAAVYRKFINTMKKKTKSMNEGNLRQWFKGSKSKDGKPGWVNVKTGGTCASDEPGEGTPKCVSSSKRASMSKSERDSASRRKKAADPGQQSKSGAAKPTYVSTDKPKKKVSEAMNFTNFKTRAMDAAKKAVGKKDAKSKTSYVGQRDAGAIAAKKMRQKDQDKVNFLPVDEAAYTGPNKEDRKVIKKLDDKDFAKKAADYEKNMDPKKRQALKDKATKGMKFTHEGTSYGMYKGSGKPTGAMAAFAKKEKPTITVTTPDRMASMKKKGVKKEGLTMMILGKEVEMVEACWKGYEKKGMKTMFGKRYPNCVKKTKKEEVEFEEGVKGADSTMRKMASADRRSGKEKRLTPAQGRVSVKPIQSFGYKEEVEQVVEHHEKDKDGNTIPHDDEKIVNESDKKGKGSGTKDACYHKVKSRYSVWPSAYASGALVKCRKKGAANWGNSKKEDFSDWKTEFIWEDGDTAKKIEEASPAWQRKEGKSESGGLNKKGVASYRAANPGSKLKTAVTTKPSKLKKGSKSANRRKSFCSRMKGMKKKLTSAKTARDPDSRINKSLRKWNC